MNQSITGIIFDIQRCSMHDGPGIRTTVFLKGCPLSCKWCHNPESQSLQPQLGFFKDKCSLCGKCQDICPQVHTLMANTHTISYSDCRACGNCINICPNKALTVFGKKVSVTEVIDVIRKDMIYYQQTGGGITISGGEPFMQHNFLKELLITAKIEGISTCVETSGFVSRPHLTELMPYIDLFLFDYKATSPKRHKEFTGVDNGLILDNLRYLYDNEKQLFLRCPIIPGYNDIEEHFRGIRHMELTFPNLSGIEILPYHDLGRGKAHAIGQCYTISEPTADVKLKSQWKEKLAACGCSQSVIQSF